MAIIFGLWAECRDAAAARQFAGHFAGLKHNLLTSRTISWAAESGIADDPDWSVSVMSFDLSCRGICSLQDALETTEAGLRLHHHLLSAPDFRYACVGIEPWGLRMADLSDMPRTLGDGRVYFEHQCVIDDPFWAELGEPGDFKPFRPGYRWLPYGGERYHPLGSTDHRELRDLQKELLPS